MTSYLDVLAYLHGELAPRTYLEIGVHRGASLRLAADDTLSVGVDPEPVLTPDEDALLHVELTTSDEFFAGARPRELFGDSPVDLAFIDGMHLFEYALRDFINLETLAGPESLVAIHDCLPHDEVTAARERTTKFWTGDVWKLVLCLLDHRPELDLTIIDIPPSGLCLVGGLDAADQTLRDGIERLVEQYVPMGYSVWKDRLDDVLRRTTDTVRQELWSLRAHVVALSTGLEESEAREASLREWLAATEAEADALKDQISVISASSSWRLTAPLRRASATLGRQAPPA